MFNNLLGSKFSKKCKYCLNCINSRVQLIRKKRQATVRCLKNDVAELLANGHDAKAFARIEALIVEINHASCYDMIEQYGQCILKQLSALQKQRECPEEAMEAISTLIFAAARISDLPELSDLRGVFTQRYGNHMESSVDALFVEKVQKKSFSMDMKLQLMQDIADEFSVRWDSKAFQHKQSNPSAPPTDQPKRSSNNNTGFLHSEMNGRSAAVNQCKEVVLDAGSEVNGRNTAALNAAASAYRRTEDVAVNGRISVINLYPPANDRNGAVINAGRSFDRRKETMSSADIAVNGKKESVTNSHRDGSFNGRKEIILDEDIKVDGRKETIIRSRNVAALRTCGAQDDPYKERWEPPLRSYVQKQQVQPELRDIHFIPIIRNGQKVPNAARETENVEPTYQSKLKGNQNDMLKDDWSKTPKLRQNGVHKDRARSAVGPEGPGLIGLESRFAAPVVSRDVKAINMVPPYNKQTVDHAPVHDDDIPKAENKVSNHSIPLRSKDARPISLIPPPYTKPHFKNENKAGEESIKSYMAAADYEKSDVGDAGKSVCVRSRLPKPALIIETGGAAYDAKVVHCRQRKETVEEMDIPSGRRKHDGRRRTAVYDGDCDEEEAAMDRLLFHYSKKGTSNEPSRRRSRTKPPLERVASLPSEPTTPVIERGVSKGPARATSLQPDLMSPNEGGLHPRLPDYDDLAARFIALKHG